MHFQSGHPHWQFLKFDAHPHCEDSTDSRRIYIKAICEVFHILTGLKFIKFQYYCKEDHVVLWECFACYGLPEQHVSVNCTSFSLAEFEEFLQQNGVCHVSSCFKLCCQVLRTNFQAGLESIHSQSTVGSASIGNVSSEFCITLNGTTGETLKVSCFLEVKYKSVWTCSGLIKNLQVSGKQSNKKK